MQTALTSANWKSLDSWYRPLILLFIYIWSHVFIMNQMTLFRMCHTLFISFIAYCSPTTISNLIKKYFSRTLDFKRYIDTDLLGHSVTPGGAHIALHPQPHEQHLKSVKRINTHWHIQIHIFFVDSYWVKFKQSLG